MWQRVVVMLVGVVVIVVVLVGIVRATANAEKLHQSRHQFGTCFRLALVRCIWHLVPGGVCVSRYSLSRSLSRTLSRELFAYHGSRVVRKSESGLVV